LLIVKRILHFNILQLAKQLSKRHSITTVAFSFVRSLLGTWLHSDPDGEVETYRFSWAGTHFCCAIERKKSAQKNLSEIRGVVFTKVF
jgi:hypothetical protein